MTDAPRTRARLLCAAAVLLAAAALALAAARGTGTVGAPSAQAATASTGSETGQQVFLRDCAWCHGTNGAGTSRAPSLTGAGEEAADFYLRTGRMPLSSPDADVRSGPPAYDDATISALVRFVGSLGNGPSLPILAAGDPVQGRKLFLENCAACHSASGTGTIVTKGEPAPELWHTGKRQVAEAVRVGPGPMPPFAEKQLDQQEVNDIVSYVHDLGAPQDKGGAGLDQYGPILEGLVALLVLLPCLLIVIRLLGKRAPAPEEDEQ